MEYPESALQKSVEQIEHWLRLCQLFRDWPADRLWELARSSRMQRYRRRTELVSRGTRLREILLVVSGSIEIAATNTSGEKYILTVLSPGQLARVVQLLDDAPLRFTYYAREDSQIVHIPGPAMVRILDAEPILWRSVARLMLRRYHVSVEVLQDQVLGSVRRRTAAKLAMIAHLYGEQELDSHHTELRISQTDLANMIGVSRQTISKELARLKDEGIIGGNDGYRLITLVDVPRLLRIVNDE